MKHPPTPSPKKKPTLRERAIPPILSAPYTPKGVKFFDGGRWQWMILVGTDEPRASIRGWLVFQNVDGQWVTLRKATADDTRSVMQLVSTEFHDGGCNLAGYRAAARRAAGGGKR